MKKLVTLLLLSAAAAVALAAGTAGSAGVPTPADYTPEQLKAMAEAPGGGKAAATRQVSPAEGPEAGSGAVSVNGSIPMTPNTICYETVPPGHNQQWGTWPQQQDVYEYRYWCWNTWGGPQVYRYSRVQLSGSWCEHNGAYGYLVSGGNGYTWSTVRSGGHFSCPSGIPWLRYNYDRWMEYACNTWGNCAFVRRGTL